MAGSGGCSSGSKAEILAQIDFSYSFIIDDFIRLPGRQHRALIDDVGVVADTQSFANVMVGDQYADPSLLQAADNLLDIQDRNRVYSGKRFIQ